VTSYNHHLVTVDLPLTFFPGVRSLCADAQPLAGDDGLPILNSSTNSWAQTRPDRVEFRRGRDVPGRTR